jgi:type IV pilus assembly protein PilF
MDGMTMRALRTHATLLAAALLLGGCATTKEPDLYADESPGDLYVRIAAEYYRLGEVELALKNAQKALEEDDDNAKAHNVMATIYQRVQRNDLAEKHFRAALRLAPDDPYTLTAWGNFLCERRKYSEAEAQFDKALAQPLFNAPWLAETWAAICARRAGQSGKAEQRLRRALTANPRYHAALFEMADLDYSRGRYKSAREYLERFFKVRGYTPPSLLLGVRIERSLGSTKRARAYERALRERFPDTPEVLSI